MKVLKYLQVKVRNIKVISTSVALKLIFLEIVLYTRFKVLLKYVLLDNLTIIRSVVRFVYILEML